MDRSWCLARSVACLDIRADRFSFLYRTVEMLQEHTHSFPEADPINFSVYRQHRPNLREKKTAQRIGYRSISFFSNGLSCSTMLSRAIQQYHYIDETRRCCIIETFHEAKLMALSCFDRWTSTLTTIVPCSNCKYSMSTHSSMKLFIDHILKSISAQLSLLPVKIFGEWFVLNAPLLTRQPKLYFWSSSMSTAEKKLGELKGTIIWEGNVFCPMNYLLYLIQTGLQRLLHLPWRESSLLVRKSTTISLSRSRAHRSERQVNVITFFMFFLLLSLCMCLFQFRTEVDQSHDDERFDSTKWVIILWTRPTMFRSSRCFTSSIAQAIRLVSSTGNKWYGNHRKIEHSVSIFPLFCSF